jgi:hypothetical protein
MVWIFASVVLICAIVFPGFRKVAFWIGGILCVGVAIALVALK